MEKLAGRARVSKRDFYKIFAGKEECFLAVYDTIVSRSVRGIIAAAEGEEGWRERLRLGLLAFVGQVVANPDAARLSLVEVFAVGTTAVERMLRTSRIFEALMAKNFALSEEAPRLPRLVVKGIVAGGDRMVRARLLSRKPRKPALDGDQLLNWALSFCDEDVVRLRGLGIAGPSPAPAAVAEVPLADERALILAATARLASREGYATLTVPRIRAAAGVSRRSFDAHFKGVGDCFLATLETLSGRALAAAAPSRLTADGWGVGVHRTIAGLCQYLAGDPAFASLVFLEVFPLSPDAIRWRSEMIARLAKMLQRGAPPRQRPTRFSAEASIGAMWGVIHDFVALGRGAQLPLAAPALSYLALAPALGGAAALDLIGAEADQHSVDRNHFS